LFDDCNKLSVGSPAFHTLQCRQINTTKLLSVTGSHVHMARLVVTFSPDDDITAPANFAHEVELKVMRMD